MKPAALLILCLAAGAALSSSAFGQPVASAPAKPAPAPAPAQTKGGGFGSSKEPIDISAKNSDVFQPQHLVVYTGEVEALQGQQRLRTPKLSIYFAEREGAPKAATKSGGPGGGFGQVQRMEAEGPVYLVTPTQSAKGNHGVYEATSDTITLTGDVVLMQDKNVARGERLVIDQKTGHTVLTSANNSRVRGVFYPQDDKPGAAR